MSTATLSATLRSESGKGAARALRRAGSVPAVIYGHKREPMSLAVPTRELERLLERVSAGSTVVELSIDGKVSRTLIREIQKHPFKKQLVHIDFQELVAGEKITVSVPLVVVGVSIGVRSFAGILDQTMRDLEVSVDPSAMPNHIDIDVSELNIGDSIHVRDIVLPAGVTVLSDPDASVVVVAAPKVNATDAAADAAAATAAAAEPEVLRAKKLADDAK
ncbi:MAG: 50S ribosomal protein L25/general stress protein Ctc [Gemmatimonadaceae bacterium]|nr:50S ribosomal protein L25/general stress protein Ctc [Gemmatimonadaceae bacterium]